MNSFGRRLRIHVLGESHGNGVGVVLDGVPPGIPVDPAAIAARMGQRRPGTGPLVSARQEPDEVHTSTGIHDGHTTGAPVTLWIQNVDVRSRDYSEVLRKPRPGHADRVNRTWSHGFADLRGGGHSSGRLTAGLVAAAALVEPLLADASVRVGAHLHAAGTVEGPRDPDAPTVEAMEAALAGSPVHTAHKDHEAAMVEAIQAAREARDSIGGVVWWRAEGVPEAWGDPFFDSVESLLAHLFFAIPAVKGVDFGEGFDASRMIGSTHNDPHVPDGATTNHAGGILGGRTTGAPLWGRVAIKPTSSIFRPQRTIDVETGEATTLELKGRHDPCIAVRAVPVVAACVRLVLADLMLQARQEGHA